MSKKNTKKKNSSKHEEQNSSFNPKLLIISIILIVGLAGTYGIGTAISLHNKNVEEAKKSTFEADPDENANLGHENKLLADPYSKISLSDLYDYNSLIAEGAAKNLLYSKNEAGTLIMSGKSSDFNTGKFQIYGDFNFDKESVKSITFDGLVTSGADVSVDIYIDGAKDPITSIKLKSPEGGNEDKGTEYYDFIPGLERASSTDGDADPSLTGLNTPGEVTAILLSDSQITGTHTISIGFTVDIEKDIDMEILMRSIEFSETDKPADGQN